MFCFVVVSWRRVSRMMGVAEGTVRRPKVIIINCLASRRSWLSGHFPENKMMGKDGKVRMQFRKTWSRSSPLYTCTTLEYT